MNKNMTTSKKVVDDGLSSMGSERSKIKMKTRRLDSSPEVNTRMLGSSKKFNIREARRASVNFIGT
jgi:hypothetical protein